MDINLVGVPIQYGCDIEGVQHGPDKLRSSSVINVFKEDNHNIYDLGNIFVPKLSDSDRYKDHKTIKFLNPIIDVTTNLAHCVYSSLESNFFPLVLGGDHCLGMGSIAGASKYFKEMAVIWVDAHGDINTPETSPSGNIHGMPLGASLGVGYPEMVNLYHDGQKVKPENTYILGARDLDQGEIDLIEEIGINLYSMADVKTRGLKTILDEINQKISASNVDGVHLSFDIDVIDSSLVPGTGTPVKNGFSIDDAKLTLEEILSKKYVTSMDFVEFNPVLDNPNESTNKLCIDLLRLTSSLI